MYRTVAYADAETVADALSARDAAGTAAVVVEVVALEGAAFALASLRFLSMAATEGACQRLYRIQNM